MKDITRAPTRTALQRHYEQTRTPSPRDFVIVEASEAASEKWGVGNAAQSKAFDTGYLGRSRPEGTQYELIHGEHPHSRNYDNTYARFADGTIEPFSGHRVLVRFEFGAYNYMKESDMSGNEIRKGGSYRLYFNDQIVYGGFARTAPYALVEIGRVLDRLLDFPVQLWLPDYGGLVGRRVKFRGAKGTISMWMPEQGAIVVDLDENEYLPPPDYLSGDELANYDPEDSDNRRIKDDILTPSSWWWAEQP